MSTQRPEVQVMTKWIFSAVAILALAVLPGYSQVVINEIMYHPGSENVAEEYIELHNRASTNVNIGGWRISNGVEFTFPSNTVIQANGYLVVMADDETFATKYPGVLNVVGNWTGILSNSRNDINLDDANGDRVDSVEYADEGDWAVRVRGPLEGIHRGWVWFKAHDGLQPNGNGGKSLELVNPALPNEHGQNWLPSAPVDGTPGAVNSVLDANIAPMILEVRHFPVVPSSSDAVTITARLLNETALNVTATLNWRISTATPPPFTSAPMFDDGAHGDGVAGDGLYGAILPAHANNVVIEFYVEASDAQSNTRTWPAAALDENGNPGQFANALYQVDDNPVNTYGGTASFQPVYKVIMTEIEREELRVIPSQSNNQGPNSQMNATFISVDAAGPALHYLVGVRNRGHASRTANPPNYRVNFRSDDRWQDVTAINLNSQQVHIQHFGSMLLNKSGSAGSYSRAVQVRINNANRALAGSPMFGSYAANEVYNSEWAERHFPEDSGGNIYKMVRDLRPPDFDYRIPSVYGLYGAEDKNSYTNTFYKETNVSEDDWTDLIGMLRVMGVNGIEEFTENAVHQVFHVERWLTHLAAMCLMGNHESGLNDGHNDDYYMYRGINDWRFFPMHHDLDQILGFGGSHPPTDGLFGMMNHPPRGSADVGGVGLMMQRFLSTNYVFRTEYLQTLQLLLDTTFSQAQFDALADQTLGTYVPVGTVNQMKNWMNQRRAHVQGLIAGNAAPGVATISGEPRSPTPSRNVTLTVGGNDIVSYRYKLNNGSYTGERLISSNIVLNSLPNGSMNTVYVIGKTSAGGWQSQANPTASRTWVVNTAWPAVRINEVLARNVAAIDHNGTFPDVIELHNEGTASVDLSGMRLTDDPAEPNKYTFPPGTSLAAGAYLALYANDPDGTPGIHLGFALNDAGEGVYLFHRVSAGGALLDSVQFGTQLPDRSIGRINGISSGTWVLCQPTEAAANVAAATGNVHALRLNEILTSPQSPFGDDFVEIYNPSPNPVDLGGLYLTDTPVGAPTRHRIHDLTFIAGNGHFVFTADGNGGEIDDLDFQLSSDVGEIALIGPGRRTIDCIMYGPQRPGISYGRCPDGASTFNFLVLPTPGSPNACPTPPPPPPTVTLVAYTNSWRYDQTGFNWGTVWREPGFDDSGWPFGQGLLAAIRGGGVFPEPVRTMLSVSNTKTTFYFRAYFNLASVTNFSGFQMTHIIDDGAVMYINGVEVNPRYNMPPAPTPVFATTLASGNILDASYVGPIALSPSYFVPGTNVIAVEVHQANPSSADIALGLLLEGIMTNDTPISAGVRINEVLANNGTIAEPDGSTPDWVEFYNPSDSAVDLVGMSVSDSTLNPDRFVFPPGSLIPARGYFTIRFDADRPPSATNTGFGLKATGDQLHLFASDNTIFDFVHFGVQAADFSIGRTGTSTWVLCVPTDGTNNIAATLGDVSQVRINEWMADPASGDDWFELYNPNPQPVSISRCFLTDDLNIRDRHEIAALSFLGANTNAWQRFMADGNTGAGADHVNFSLRAAGEAIGLYTTNRVKIDEVTFGQQTEGVSQGRLLDGATNIVSFPGTPSPGDPNYVLMNNVVINEVLTHTDVPLEDAIEIRNIGATPVNVSGWWLSDSRGLPRKYQITNNSPPIPAGGFRVFYEYQFNDRDQTFLPFALSSASGDEVYLSATTNNALNGARAQAEFGAAENGVSFGRYVNSQGNIDYTAMRSLSFGTSVTKDSPPSQITLFRTGQGATNPYPKIGPLVITEVMYHPPDNGTNDNLIDEFVEIHNPGPAAVPLYDPAAPTNRWRLRDGVDFDFPPGRSVPSGGYLLVVSFNPTNDASALSTFRARYPASTNSALVGPYSGKLDNGGEGVKLQKPDFPQPNGSVPYVLVDYVVYSDRAPWPTNADGWGSSLQRRFAMGYANDPTNWIAAAATPGPASPLDSDSDGLPDSWEQQYFGHPTAANPNSDSDNDGMTNLQEYHAGTHPLVTSSRLRINPLSVSKVGNNLTFQFSAVSNRTYTVQYNTSLSNNTWTLLTTLPSSTTNRIHTITDSSAGSTGQRFYRVATP
jgi:hypothetical protein